MYFCLGFDSQIWQQAVRENPDPDKLLPYPIRGFEQLRKRQELQVKFEINHLIILVSIN